jgi:hypothetical protein
MMEKAQDALGGLDSVALSATEPRLAILAQVLERVFRSAERNSSKEYKLFISEEPLKTNYFGGVQGRESNTRFKKRLINFWAFCPGIAMEELKLMGVRSIILTSGDCKISFEQTVS